MSFVPEQDVEHIIPVTLQMDERASNINEGDSHSEPSDSQQTEPDFGLLRTKEDTNVQNVQGSIIGQKFGFYAPNSWTQVNESGRQCPGHTSHNIYQPLPPTINIFACPPPPPPYVGGNGYQSFSRPRFVPGYSPVQIPGSSFHSSIPNIAPQSSTCLGDDHAQARADEINTPPPPELTTPFHCEDSKTHIPQVTCRSPKQNKSRFHPYHDPSPQRGKYEPEMDADKRSFLCVDAQDFNASEISVKVKENKLIIEGTKLTNQKCGRFVSMKQEFTFRSQTEAKNTSCTFHPNGTLILQFKHVSGEPDIASQEPSTNKDLISE